MNAYPEFRLGDIADVAAGDPAPQDSAAFAPEGPLFVRMQDVGRHHHNSTLITSTDHLCENWLKRNRLRLFAKNSILIPKSGASVNLNHRAKLATDAYVVSHLAVVTPYQHLVDPEYLFWWSVGYDPRTHAQVTSLPSLKLATLKAARVPLPPLHDQRRIAAILDRAARVLRLHNQASDNLKELTHSLYSRMFGDPLENPFKWKTMPLGVNCVLNQYGTSKKSNDRSQGVPILRMGNITYDGHLDCTDLKYVDLPHFEAKKYALCSGDLLFNRTNSRELVGKTGIWDGRFYAVAASYFIRLQVDKDVLCPLYVWAFMNTSTMKRRLFNIARGAIGQANINARELLSLPLPIPPLDRQHDYGEIVRDLTASAATVQATSKVASTIVCSLMTRLIGTRVR